MANNGTFTLGVNAQFTNISSSVQFKGNQNDSSNVPSFTWTGDEKTGLFRQSSNVIGASTGGVNRLTIGSNIGVGVSNPLQALDVAGNINFSGSLFKAGVPYVGSQWSNNGSNIFALGSNVGINTSAPQRTLDVNGDIGCSNISVSGFQMSLVALATNLATVTGSNFTVTGDSSNAPGHTWQQNSNTGMYWGGSNIIGFSAGGSSKMVVGSNVGIGTTTPSTLLSVAAPGLLFPNKSYLAYYPFNGDARDAYGTNNLTVTGCSFTTNPAKFGSSLFLNNSIGVSGGVNNVIGSLSFTGSLTVTFWFRTTATSGGNNIQDMMQIAGSSSTYLILRLGGVSPALLLTGATDVVSSISISANQWYHYAAVTGSTGTQLYLNGTLVGATTTTPSSSWLTVASKTWQSSGTWGMNGYLDDIRFFNTMLTAQEVFSLYNAPNQTDLPIINANDIGFVGIGVSNPQYALDVAGGARFTGSITTSNIMTGSITTSNIMTGSITASNIIMGTVTSGTLSVIYATFEKITSIPASNYTVSLDVNILNVSPVFVTIYMGGYMVSPPDASFYYTYRVGYALLGETAGAGNANLFITPTKFDEASQWSTNAGSQKISNVTATGISQYVARISWTVSANYRIQAWARVEGFSAYAKFNG